MVLLAEEDLPLARDLLYRGDPVEFARDAGFEPDDWQAEVLRSHAPRILLNCSRQAGKSMTVAALAAFESVYPPGGEPQLTLILATTERQASETLRKVKQVLFAHRVPLAEEGATSVQLRSGARVVALPSKEQTVRGYSGVALLLFDEAARVPDHLYATCRPMLAVSQGRIIALSTPFFARGWWHKAWVAPASEGWVHVEIPASQCPRISPTFLEEERRNHAPLWFAQEYECQFSPREGGLFRADELEAAAKEYATWVTWPPEDIADTAATDSEGDAASALPSAPWAVDRSVPYWPVRSAR